MLTKLTKLIIEFKEGLTNFEPEDLKQFRRKEKSIKLIQKSVQEEIQKPNALFLVAEEKNKLIGFAFGTLKENKHMVFKTVKYGMLNHIWVSKKFREQGLSSKFKDELFKWFNNNNCKYITLLVLDANPAKQIYEKWGFEIVLDSMEKII